VTAPDRAVARDAVEEANAAIGAAISTCSLSTDVKSLLTEIQYELMDLTEAVSRGEPGPEPDRLHRALQHYGVDAPPRGFAVLGGVSNAAGLLKLARAVTRRASRAVTALPEGGGPYMELLAELLLAVAFHGEEAEEQELAQVPFGVCGSRPVSSVVRPTLRSY
jgi:cob(I)alamin adenosyltransferase